MVPVASSPACAGRRPDFHFHVALDRSETAHESRGFLTPPEALDALTTFGFNLLSLSGKYAFDLKAKDIQNTIREAESRAIVRKERG